MALDRSWGQGSLPDVLVFSKTLAAEAKVAERIIHGAVVDGVHRFKLKRCNWSERCTKLELDVLRNRERTLDLPRCGHGTHAHRRDPGKVCLHAAVVSARAEAGEPVWETQETRPAVRVLVTQQLDLPERGARAAVRKCDVMARADMREEEGLGALMCARGHLGIAPWGCAWRVSKHVLGDGSGSATAMKQQKAISVEETLCSGCRGGDDYWLT